MEIGPYHYQLSHMQGGDLMLCCVLLVGWIIAIPLIYQLLTLESYTVVYVPILWGRCSTGLELFFWALGSE